MQSIEIAAREIELLFLGTDTKILNEVMKTLARSYAAWLQMATLETGKIAKAALDELAANIELVRGSIRRICIGQDRQGNSLAGTRYMLGWHRLPPPEAVGTIDQLQHGLNSLLIQVRECSEHIDQNGLNKKGAGNFGEALTGSSSMDKLVLRCRECLPYYGIYDQTAVKLMVQAIDEAVVGDIRKGRQGKSQVGRKSVRRSK